MKILPPEKEIEIYKEGFDDSDILERKEVGKALSDLVGRIDDPMVIALDGKWGTGKSYFLKRWIGEHSMSYENSCTTVFFDAFSHDYLSDPLPALISALAERVPNSKEKKIAKVKDTALAVLKPMVRIGLSMASFGADKELGELAGAVANAVGKETEAGLSDFWAEEKSRHAAMTELKVAISQLAKPIAEGAEGCSVLIVIDELDRCRPDFALTILEIIKHFFAVPHLHFVLGVNLDALENSVRARYGEKIDAKSYLQKFINVTLDLPTELGGRDNRSATGLKYLEHLIAKMALPADISYLLKTQVKLTSNPNPLPLRTIEKIVSSVSLANNDLLHRRGTMDIMIVVMLDLIISKIAFPSLYPKFLGSKINDDELAVYLGTALHKIPPMLDGERNPDYDRDVSWRFHMWKYIVKNGDYNIANSSLVDDIGFKLSMSDYQLTPREIPERVRRDFLDTFSFYSA
ncbi:MAG: hypothetical protein JXR13_04150 [Thalassovita sp.]